MSGSMWESRRRAFLAAILLSGLATPALAQRELRIKSLPEVPQPFVTTVVAPAARFAAVSDTARVLAVAHRPKSPAHLSIYKLDEQGQVVPGDPVTLTLPKPAALGDRPNFVLGLACHPRFPLLYVWQDVEMPPAEVVLDPATGAELDHLFIYSLEESPPKLLTSLARGKSFHFGDNEGAMALDAPATRLYVPNLERVDEMKKPAAALGFIRIAPDGLPTTRDAATSDINPSAGPPAPQLDPAAAAASRAARLPVLEATKTAGAAQVLGLYSEPSAVMLGWPCPYSVAPVSDDVVMMATHAGAIGWNLADRTSRFNNFYLQPYIAYRHRLSAHPQLPLVYMAIVTYDGRLMALEHVDGYITLTPQQILVDTMVSYTAPLVLPKMNRLAVGGAGKVCFIDLDERGRFKASGVQMTVNNPTTSALAWSERFGKLYVPVEKTP